MRPLRLLLDGFGSYRQPVDADFSDVDFFALVGPTGSGKSTLIDGLCFALYGTVPRWGKENVIAHALAPSANSCRVCLVFETAARRYVAERLLTRDAKGRVHTKEARLERLDPSVGPDAPLAEILAASIEQIAEGPDEVSSGVRGLLGLSYDHFTQSVLLPQGKFSEFLQANAVKRQDLLVELLAFGVYEEIGQRARERAKRAADRKQIAEQARQELADATAEAETLAAARVDELARLTGIVEGQLAALAALGEQAQQAQRRARDASDESALLAALRMPPGITGLAARITQAEAIITERGKQRDEAERTEAAADRARAELPDKALTERFRAAHAARRRLMSLLEQHERELAATQQAEAAMEKEREDSERERDGARDALARAERGHAAVGLAGALHVGDDCPVCLQPVAALPQHAMPADLAVARKAVDAATRDHKHARAAHADAAKVAVRARGAVEGTQDQLDEIAATLADAPGEADVTRSLMAIAAADEALGRGRNDARARRAEVSAAEKARSSLAGDERNAWAALRDSRDRLVRLGAPAVDGTELAEAWETLTAWAAAQRAERAGRQPELDAAARALRQRTADDAAALTRLLASHGIGEAADPAQAPVLVARHRVRAEERLAALRRDLEKAAQLDRQITADTEEAQVAGMLGSLLKANSFERWLCGEALDSLVTEASATLMELSGDQYQLDRDDRNELVAIDHNDAGARRPVHTLSGGETFQASLALALALSRQVVGLSAGMRDLNSMFLDEGFGSLDEDTLETVATTLERLAADSGRMVGIVTHVAALAGRVPVRFVVSRAGTTSMLRKEKVL